MAKNWPIGAAELATALEISDEERDEQIDELELFARTACSLIDRRTGRHVDPNRHELADGTLPPEFALSAREQGKHMWNQTKNGPRARPDEGAPMGVGVLAKVDVWLQPYPGRIFYGDRS